MTNSYKYFRWVLLILSAALGMVSCEQKEIVFEGPYHVRFTQADTTIRESYVRPIPISVHNAGPQLSTPITVKYVIGGNAREGIDYRILGTKGTVVIPANQSFGYVQLQLINNANNILEKQDIVFNITEVEPTSLRIGFGSGEIGKTMRFTIEDDCFLSGSYAGANLSASPTVIRTGISITSTNCNEYILSNWNIGLFGLNAIKPDLQFIDKGDNSITIPPQTETYLTEPRDTIRGDGFVNPVDRSITFTIRFNVLGSRQQDSLVVLNLKYTPEK